MPINTESLNNDLYRLLSKYKPKPLDAEGKVTPVPEEADIFKFDFTKDGKDYGTVFATLDENRVLTLYFGDDVTQSPDGKTPGLDYDDTWWGLYHQLSAWRITKGLKGFESHNKDRVADDMAKRKHMRNKDKIAEGYYATGKKSSYSDAVPSVKIVIEHSRVIEEGEQRYRNINRIFLENQAGERYLLDTKKPGIARVYARHIAEGGKVNDDRWSHIGNLCEEYQKMAGFVRATRNGQFNESAQSLVNEGIAHYQSLRESLSRMTGKRGYNIYFENWTPALMEDGTEENNLNELFVQETLDPRIESVMPILNRIHKKVSESVVDKEMNKLAEWADSLVEEGGESLTSNNPVGIPEDEELDESEMDESALQAYLGDKKYGEKGMDALRKAGRKHASKTKMQNIRAKFSNKEEGVAEGHQVVLGIDREKYTERPGLEGPFSTKSGKVVYYDKQEGKYYDPGTDFYISHDDYQAMNEQGMTEKIIGKPKIDHMDNAGHGSYSAAENTASTQHRLGSHEYEVTTEQDGDGDLYYFIYVDGKQMFYATSSGVYEDKLGSRISSALLDEHKKATAHLFDSDEDEDEDDLREQGVAEDYSKKRHHFIYEAGYFSADLQSKLDANKSELDKTRAAGDAKWQAYKDQQAQIKADYIQQNAASNAEHVKQREEEYQARLKRDKEAQEKQDARTKPGYRQRPGNDDDARQPHGDTANEIKMFMAGTKPAAAIGELDQSMWQNIIDSGKYVVKQLFKEKGKPGSIVIGQPGEEDRVEKIASLIQGASDLADKGDFSAYHNSNYHRWLGRLLGYPADKIEKFIAGYFRDVKDLAKGRFDENAKNPEQGVAEDLDANQKRVGQLGPTEKVKNNNIGKLVGANENFINTVDQAVVSEEDEMAESILSAIKKVGKKVIDTVAPGDEELLKQLDKDVHGGKVPNRYNSDSESAKKYPADDELDRILQIMNHRR